MKRPCIGCGTPTNGSRCATCERQRNARRIHYRGNYRKRARAVVDAANADPTTRCRRCGELARIADPWTAGHIIDTDPTSPLAPEHASCNYGAGGRLGAQHRH